MKKFNDFTRRTVSALFAGLVLTLVFGAQSAQAQSYLQAFVDCVERERDSSGAFTDNYIVHFGYTNDTTNTYTLPYTSGNNFYSPDTNPKSNPPTIFSPGVHRRVVSVTVPIGSNQTWFLGTSFVIASFSEKNFCGESGANSRLITYQGKLSDGAAAANGVYDLQFQLFNQLTGGAARTSLITLDDVQVTNGVFTVQLDLGKYSLPAGNPGTAVPNDLKLNPAILDAENSFFEISVRAGNSTGAYTTLTPRQPLTAVPLAMRSELAATAFRAVNADNATNSAQLNGVAASGFVRTNDSRLSDTRTPTAGSSNYVQNTTTQQASTNFNISGSGTVGGTLTANKLAGNGVLARGGAPGGNGVNNNGYAFSGNGGDNDSGLFSEANGRVSLFSDSVERARVDGGGLTVTGNITATGTINGVVRTINGLNGAVTLAGGPGISVTPSGNTITLSLTGTSMKKFAVGGLFGGYQYDIVHNLGTTDVIVQVYDQNGNQIILGPTNSTRNDGSAQIRDANTVRVALFSTGTYRVVIIG